MIAFNPPPIAIAPGIPFVKRILAYLSLASILTGCGSAAFPPHLDSPKVPFVAAVGAGAFYLYKDNWTVEEIPVNGDKFRLTLRKNILRSDGNSEAGFLFKRRAGEIVAEHGFDGYRIMEYSEGIESAALGSQRVAQGVIQCYREAAPAK